MKNKIKIILVIIFSQFVFSCENNNLDSSKRYTKPKYYPVAMKRSEFEKAVTSLPAREMENTGKIYFKDDYIFIVEKYKGIHVINNENVLKPEKIAFIRIPGCLNMSIKQNYLFADSSTDLVTIDIADYYSVKEISRQRSIFPEPLPPEASYTYNDENRPSNSIIVEWQEVK